MQEKEPLHKIAQSWATTISLILIPLMVGYMANSYQEESNRQKINSGYIRLAIDILREEPTQKNKAIRLWAINIIEKYSEVKLSINAKQGLIEYNPIITSKGYYVVPRDQILKRTEDGIMTERDYFYRMIDRYRTKDKNDDSDLFRMLR